MEGQQAEVFLKQAGIAKIIRNNDHLAECKMNTRVTFFFVHGILRRTGRGKVFIICDKNTQRSLIEKNAPKRVPKSRSHTALENDYNNYHYQACKQNVGWYCSLSKGQLKLPELHRKCLKIHGIYPIVVEKPF